MNHPISLFTILKTSFNKCDYLMVKMASIMFTAVHNLLHVLLPILYHLRMPFVWFATVQALLSNLDGKISPNSFCMLRVLVAFLDGLADTLSLMLLRYLLNILNWRMGKMTSILLFVLYFLLSILYHIIMAFVWFAMVKAFLPSLEGKISPHSCYMLQDFFALPDVLVDKSIISILSTLQALLAAAGYFTDKIILFLSYIIANLAMLATKALSFVPFIGVLLVLFYLWVQSGYTGPNLNRNKERLETEYCAPGLYLSSSQIER